MMLTETQVQNELWKDILETVQRELKDGLRTGDAEHITNLLFEEALKSKGYQKVVEDLDK
jgi:hypothetical protein